MLKVLMGVAALYGISWVVSTPEGRAAAKPEVERFGRKLLAWELAIIAAVMAWATVFPPP